MTRSATTLRSSALLMALALPAALPACSRSEAAAEKGNPALGGKVDGRRAKQLVAEGAVLLDVRSPGEFAGGHAPGAINIPVHELDTRHSELPEGKAVVTYCAAGVRSKRAADKLRKLGHTVHDLGSLSDWPED